MKKKFDDFNDYKNHYKSVMAEKVTTIALESQFMRENLASSGFDSNKPIFDLMRLSYHAGYGSALDDVRSEDDEKLIDVDFPNTKEKR